MTIRHTMCTSFYRFISAPIICYIHTYHVNANNSLLEHPYNHYLLPLDIFTQGYMHITGLLVYHGLAGKLLYTRLGQWLDSTLKHVMDEDGTSR